MNKLLFLPLLAIILSTGGCAEKNKEKKLSPCDCTKSNNHRFLELNLSFSYAYKNPDISLIFQDLYPNNEDMELYRDSIDGYDIFEWKNLRKSENSGIPLQILDKFIFSGIFIFNVATDYGLSDAPQLGFAKAEDTTRIKDYIIANSKNLSFYDITLVWDFNETNHIPDKSGYYALYAIKNNSTIISIEDVEHAEVIDDPNSGQQSIHLVLTKRGAYLFAEYTKKQVGDFLAITFNHKVLIAPKIHSPITDGKIQISGGNINTRETENLTRLINCKVLYENMGEITFVQAVEKCE